MFVIIIYLYISLLTCRKRIPPNPKKIVNMHTTLVREYLFPQKILHIILY